MASRNRYGIMGLLLLLLLFAGGSIPSIYTRHNAQAAATHEGGR